MERALANIMDRARTCAGGGVKKGEQWSVLTVIIKCEISCTHPIVTIKDGCHRLNRVRGAVGVRVRACAAYIRADGFIYIFFFGCRGRPKRVDDEEKLAGSSRAKRISECYTVCAAAVRCVGIEIIIYRARRTRRRIIRYYTKPDPRAALQCIADILCGTLRLTLSYREYVFRGNGG